MNGNSKNAQFYISNDHGDNWKNFNPAGLQVQHSKSFVSINPTTYLTYGNGTIVKSTDNGNSWKNSTTGFYSNETRVEDNFGLITKYSSKGGRFLNNKQEWDTVVGVPKVGFSRSLLVNDKIINYYYNDSTFLISSDKGISFKMIPNTLPYKYTNLSLSSSGSIIVASGSRTKNIQTNEYFNEYFISKDEAKTWINIIDKVPHDGWGTLTGGKGNFYFYGSHNTAFPSKVFKSSDSSINFVEISKGNLFEENPYFTYFTIVDSKNILVYALNPSKSTFKYSYNNLPGGSFYLYDGESWSPVEVDLPAGTVIGNILYTNNNYFITTNEKLYHWDVATNQIKSISGNLETGLNINSIVMNKGKIYLGTAAGLYTSSNFVTANINQKFNSNLIQL